MQDGRDVNQSDVTTESLNLLGTPIEFSSLGAISKGDRLAVVDMLEKVLDSVDDPVTHLRVRMEHDSNRNRDRQTTVRTIIDFKGGAVRAHITSESTRSAIDLLEARLRSQLRHRSQRRKAQQHRSASSGAGEWRHGDLTTERPPYFPRPADERELVRHKSVAPAESSVEEALFDLQMMDYDFYLFIHLGTGRDALVRRESTARNGDETTHVVQFVGGAADVTVDEWLDGVVVVDDPAPVLDVGTATQLLDVGDEPWVFFQDAKSGRGHVLYRRFDGHYGMIVPINEPD